MELFEDLSWRGLVQDVSDAEGTRKLVPGDAFYVGFDPTAPSLHVGNLIQLLVAAHLTRKGLRPIILFGGATGMIGDPGGKSAERNLLELAQVESHLNTQADQVRALWPRLAPNGVVPQVVNNFEWTKGVSLLEFLRDVGKHFTVNYMIAKEAVETRLNGSGISYTEFSYMLLQAFDFYHLHTQHGCKLQFGGSDQWGNITAGLELIRRKIQGEAFAFSTPLVTDSTGKKFGKSEGNAVWLDPEKTSPYRFHQFWLNVADADVAKLLRLFTFKTKNEVADLERAIAERPEAREAQRALADEVCTLIHGEDATRQATRCAAALFGSAITDLSKTELLDVFSEAPSTTIRKSEIGSLDLVSLLATTLTASKGEAKRLVSGGGVYVNNERLSDGGAAVATLSLLHGELLVLRSGKKNYHLVRVAE